MVDKYTVRTETAEKIPVVARRPAARRLHRRAAVELLAHPSSWRRTKTYRLHLTAMDYNHGFSLQPANINIQVVPGYEHVVTVTPEQSGTYRWCATNIAGSAITRWSAASTSSEGRQTCPARPYRILPRSGLQFEANAEKLMLANAVAAVVFLLIGGILPSAWCSRAGRRSTGFEADTFYKVLTAHGIDMLIFWIIFFEIAVLYFCLVDAAALPIGDAEDRLAGLRADGDRRDRQQRRGSTRAARA